MFPRILLLAVGGWWLLAAPARAQTRWVETGAAVDEVVADTESAVPAGALTPLVTRTPFDNFRYPHVDARENVTFIADDVFYGSKGLNHGIYRSPKGGALKCLVRGGETLVPGSGATLKGIRGLQMDENGIDFIFNAFDSENKRGLYHWSGGRLETVARTGITVLPGEGEPLTCVEYGALSGGRVLYHASTPQHESILVLHDLAAGTDRVLCRTGVPVPGQPDETFRYIATQNWLTGDSIIFRTEHSEQAELPDRRNLPADGQAAVYGWFGIKDWSAGSGDLAPASLRVVVNAETAVPVPSAPAGAAFKSITSTPLAGRLTAFQADGDGFDGVFLARTPAGAGNAPAALRDVVDDHTEVTGLFKGTFTNFGIWPTVIGQSVVFTADAAHGLGDGQAFHGVFLYRADTDALFVLADNRAKLEGKTIAAFEIAGHFLSGNRFAVTVKFADKSAGVYLATIPPRAFRRISGGTAPLR